MDWQQPVSLAVVVFTVYFFVRHEIRARRRSRSRACGSDCGCTAGDEERPMMEPSRTNQAENGGIVRPERETADPLLPAEESTHLESTARMPYL
jgi:hypothetical protein